MDRRRRKGVEGIDDFFCELTIMRGRSNGRKRPLSTTSKIAGDSSSVPAQTQQNCYEGERLASLLKSIRREMESVMRSDRVILPEKLCLKKQFSIGVNEVTRVLERMNPLSHTDDTKDDDNLNKAPSIKLQAILLANDCNPRWLTKHLLGLASSREVPLIFVRDMKGGSLRLGELVKLKTAIAVGIKARGNAINQLVADILLE
ncbi:hypothetical protein LIER_36350 [Lithospermum erythrorhizon]|uniref:Ribosomal protein eL8/eL30/eS12/Gadd45 domain-containing protein n=1 Tax=Lithospermum erythrorhizon TaxID=34254 RepID=A0AAV3P7D5_LITER